MRRWLVVLALGLALVSTGCIGRRVDEKEEIDKVLNQVMQAIAKEDVTHLEQVLVPDLESSISWEGRDGAPYSEEYHTNSEFVDAWFNFGTWSYSAAQLTARTIEVTNWSATATGAYMDRYMVNGNPDCDWIRTSPLKAELRHIGGKWRVTRLEFLDWYQERVSLR